MHPTPLAHAAGLALALALAAPAPAAEAPAAPAASHPAPTSDDPAATPASPLRRLPREAVAADLALLRAALWEAHPGLHRYAAPGQIDAAWETLQREALAAASDTDLALYGRLSRFLAEIRCDHTKAELPEALTAWREAQPTHLPFRFRLFGGRMIVASSDPAQPPLARGTEVLAINGQPVAALLAALRPMVSIDGDTEPSRDAKLAADSDLMGSDLDQFLPVVQGLATRFTLQVRPHDAAPGTPAVEATMQGLRFAEWTRLPWSSTPWRDEFYRSITWRVRGDTARLRIDTFVNYRHEVDAHLLLGAFFKAARDQGVRHLILDLRDNGGGSSEPALALAAHLLPEPFVWNRPFVLKALRFGDWTRHMQTWGDPRDLLEPPLEDYVARPDGGFERRPGPKAPELLPRAPAEHRFTGRVSVLTSPGNGSGATMLIAKLRDAGRVVTVGEPTGGSAEGPTAGRLFFLKLPASGIVVRIPNQWNRMALGHFEPRRGVAPDIPVTPSIEAFVAGEDDVLAAAIAAARAAPLPGTQAP